MMLINLLPPKHRKRCGACGVVGHMRQICPMYSYNGETLKQRRIRQEEQKIRWEEEHWASRDIEREREHSRSSYTKHAKDRIDKVTAYRAANPDKVKQWRDNFWILNKERLTAERKIVRERLYSEDSRGTWFKETFNAARGRARRAGLPFDSDFPILELPTVCPVLSIALDYSCNKGRRQMNSPSLDRIRPELGYVANNLRIISFRANQLKNDATIAELRAVLTYMECTGCL